LLAGAAFGAGAGLVSPSIIRYGAAIAQLSPLYNLNVLIIVVLGLLIFSEFFGGASFPIAPGCNSHPAG
jgi:hypothetical protein